MSHVSQAARTERTRERIAARIRARTEPPAPVRAFTAIDPDGNFVPAHTRLSAHRARAAVVNALGRKPDAPTGWTGAFRAGWRVVPVTMEATR